ncbi:unnamed protein product [Prunus armeniaca]
MVSQGRDCWRCLARQNDARRKWKQRVAAMRSSRREEEVIRRRRVHTCRFGQATNNFWPRARDAFSVSSDRSPREQCHAYV